MEFWKITLTKTKRWFSISKLRILIFIHFRQNSTCTFSTLFWFRERIRGKGITSYRKTKSKHLHSISWVHLKSWGWVSLSPSVKGHSIRTTIYWPRNCVLDCCNNLIYLLLRLMSINLFRFVEKRKKRSIRIRLFCVFRSWLDRHERKRCLVFAGWVIDDDGDQF